MTSGVKIRDTCVGTGVVAERDKVAVVHYRCFLNRGEERANTYKSGQPAQIHLGKREAIAGLQQGIEGMRESGRREIEVSPHLAYGEKGVQGWIPPNAVLRFEVELLEVREPGERRPEDYPPGKQLSVMRHGEMARRLSRWQFGLSESGEAGVYVTKCPPPGVTWRHAVMKHVTTKLTPEVAAAVFASVSALSAEHADKLLGVNDCWSDTSEKANNITRDQKTNIACLWVGVFERGSWVQSFYVTENSPLLLRSTFYLVATEVVTPHLPEEVKASPEPQA